MAGSSRELQFMRLWQMCPATKDFPPPVTQFRFHPTRRWLFDFAWPAGDGGVSVEVQGGTWARGKSGHTSGTGVQRDNEKSNAAALLGWTTLKYTSTDLDRRPVQVVEEVLQALKRKASNDT